MLARSRTLLVLAVASVLAFAVVGAGDDRPPALAELLPSETGLFVQASDAAKLVDAVLASGVREKLGESAAWRAFLESDDGQELERGIAFVTGAVGFPPFDMARRLLDGEIALALLPPVDDKPMPLLLARPRDPEVLKRIMGAVTLFAGQRVEKVTHKGVDATVIGDAVFFWAGGTFVLGNHRATLEKTIDRLRGDSEETSFAESERYRAVRSELEGLGPVRVFIDLELIRAQGGGELKRLEEPFPEPLVSLIFGGYRQLIAGSRSIAVGITGTPAGLTLRGVAAPVSSAATGHPCYFPAAEPETVAAPPGTIARFNVRRNVSAWWDARLELVSESSHAAMSRFATEIGNILGGRDFGEEILALAGDGIELLVIAPGSTPDGQHAPEPLLPGFALAVPLERGDGLEPRLQALFQTVIAFVNIDLAQKDRAPLLLGTETHHGVTITRAAPPSDMEPDDTPGIEANFAPALAVQNGTLLLASHVHAVKELIEAGATAARSRAAKNGELHIDAGALRAILEANRSSLVANGVLEGKTMGEATAELDLLTTIIGCFEGLDIELAPTADGLELCVELGFDAAPRSRTEKL